MRFGGVRLGAVARVEVLIENGGDTPVPCTVPEHYLEHAGLGNSVCIRLPHGLPGLLQRYVRANDGGACGTEHVRSIRL